MRTVGDPVEDPLSPIGYRRVPIGCHRLAHAPSSMVTMAAFGQMSRTLSPLLVNEDRWRHPQRRSAVSVSTLYLVTRPDSEIALISPVGVGVRLRRRRCPPRRHRLSPA